MKRSILLVALLSLAGCMTPGQKREDTLIREARTFNDDMRWARYDAIATSLSKEEAPLFRARVASIADEIVMADYEVLGINFEPGTEAAMVTAKFEWYMKSDPTLRATTVQQRWRFDDGRWVMAEQRRTRGDRFPLVTEKVTPPGP